MVSLARRIAYDVLQRVESQGAYASEVLHDELGARVSSSDAALATEISLGVLRWRALLDFMLAIYASKGVERLDLPVTLALRVGLYQLRFLQRIPPRAVVSESVELVKRARKASAAGFVNAILRRAADEATRPAEDFVPHDLPETDRLAILHSHPRWLVEKWLAQFGAARAMALFAANNRAAAMACALTDPKREEEVAAGLRASGLIVESGTLLRSALIVRGGSVRATPAFKRGEISIQDEASQTIPLLLGVKPGNRVLDLCAAPGGKTAVLARAADLGMSPGGAVIAADRHSHRIRAMRAHFGRLGLRGMCIVQLNAEESLPFAPRFDRILVDAPCCGTGTLARHPEIRWRLQPERLAGFHALQAGILKNALEALAPGGRLVYSTCSLEPEENEQVVADVLGCFPRIRVVSRDESARLLAPHLAEGIRAKALHDERGFFRTLPGELPTDGFFGAVLEKN